MSVTIDKLVDPFYAHSKVTHNAVIAPDSGVPAAANIFFPVLNCNVLKARAVLSAGTATIRLKEYSAKLSKLAGTDVWLNGEKYDISAGATTLTPSWKFDTTGAIVAPFVEALAGGNLTLECALAPKEVANN